MYVMGVVTMKTLNKRAWIDAALEALSEEGSKSLSIVKLAQKLGVTRGSFYYHFDSLSHLIDAMIARWESEVIDRVFREARALSATAVSEVESLIDLVTQLTDKQDIVFRQWAPHNEQVRLHMERLDQKRLSIMTDLFQRLVGEDVLGASYAKIAFYGYIGCLNSYPRPSSEQQRQMALEILGLFSRQKV